MVGDRYYLHFKARGTEAHSCEMLCPKVQRQNWKQELTPKPVLHSVSSQAVKSSGWTWALEWGCLGLGPKSLILAK